MMISPTFSPPQTLPELLHSRAQDPHSTAKVAFVGADGHVTSLISLAELYRDSTQYACRLLAAGLSSADIVLASFPDHEHHIRLFWACCLAGIPVCPLPAPHPDKSRQKLLLDHLQKLFHQPTLVAHTDTIRAVHQLAPDLKVLELQKISDVACDTSRGVYPARIASPTDLVCLMLTSGSTGNSKAVQLSHSNILSSVRGKIQHHATSSSSRFFNWIAFDHVACLSEIHVHAIEANAR
jgi:acyl-CoA synthetase (AMP-forming)/AMP-acid ligase II